MSSVDNTKTILHEDICKARKLGAIPLPVVGVLTDVAVVVLQMKMVRDIGNYFDLSGPGGRAGGEHGGGIE